MSQIAAPFKAIAKAINDPRAGAPKRCPLGYHDPPLPMCRLSPPPYRIEKRDGAEFGEPYPWVVLKRLGHYEAVSWAAVMARRPTWEAARDWLVERAGNV